MLGIHRDNSRRKRNCQKLSRDGPCKDRWQPAPYMVENRIDGEIRDLIRRMSLENPLWGAPRIHAELPMLGIEVAVARYMTKRQRPPSQGWKTFLRNHAAGIASIDLFVVRTISFKLLYGLVILRHARRRLVSISVTNNPTAEWIVGQVTDAFPWDEAPRHLIRDRDGAFGPRTPAVFVPWGSEIRPISLYISSNSGESCVSAASASSLTRRSGCSFGTRSPGSMIINIARCRRSSPRIRRLLHQSD